MLYTCGEFTLNNSSTKSMRPQFTGDARYCSYDKSSNCRGLIGTPYLLWLWPMHAVDSYLSNLVALVLYDYQT